MSGPGPGPGPFLRSLLLHTLPTAGGFAPVVGVATGRLVYFALAGFAIGAMVAWART